MTDELVHPTDHLVSLDPEPWTGRTDLSYAQIQERAELLRESVADGLRVIEIYLKRGVALEDIEIYLKRGVALEDIEDEFRKVDGAPLPFTWESVEAEAKFSETDRELRRLRRGYYLRTTFAEVFHETIRTTIESFKDAHGGYVEDGSWYCLCTSPPNNGEDGPERKNPRLLRVCPDCGTANPRMVSK